MNLGDLRARRRRVAAVALSLCCVSAWADICRVTTAGTEFGLGTWADPVSFTRALVVPDTCTEIWVAQGIYKPTTGADRSATFTVRPGVEVYGGFDGSETLREQRAPAENLTVLSGDIDGNDTVDANGIDVDATHIMGANSIHVVYMDGTTGEPIGPTTVLDGFTITGGQNDVNTDGFATGGGLYCLGTGPTPGQDCSPSLANLRFIGNSAYLGGAVTLNGYATQAAGSSSPSFRNVEFSGNRALQDGGAINCNGDQGACNPTFDGVTFSGNTAVRGGAVILSGSGGSSAPVFRNVTFRSNVASQSGGAIYAQFGASVTFTNATFNDNRATDAGGAIYLYQSNATLGNTILWDDRVPLGNPGREVFRFDPASVTVDHGIVQGGCPDGAACTNLLTTDPLLGPLAYDRGATRTMLPGTGSPAIDAGDDATCAAADQRDVTRPQGAHCDIGAVEIFAVDLIGHKGAEACWSQALAEPAFLGLMQSSIDGAVTCIAPVSGSIAGLAYTACNTAACAGGAMGCPVTTHAGPLASSGAFASGNFSGTGSVDDFSLPVTFTGLGSCTYDATGIATRYAPEYIFTDDGNFGVYAALLNRSTVSVTDYEISSGNITCQAFSGNVGPAMADIAQKALTARFGQNLRDASAGQSVCPLTP